MGLLTSDKEVLETVSDMPIARTSETSHRQCFQHPFSKTESKCLEEELHSLLNKKRVTKSKTESGKYVSPIFVRG